MAELTRKMVKAVYDRDNGICQLCFLPVGERDWDIDHIIPRSFGGQNFRNNLRLTHSACNNARADDLTNAEKNQMLSDQLEKQHGNCWICQQYLKFSMVNKVAVDYRLPVSWDNMALVHSACRVEYNSRVVHPWNEQMKKIRGGCIRRIIGVD